MLSRFKNLKNFDQRRLDVALLRIRGKKPLIVAFNIFLLLVNSLGLIKRIVKKVLAKLGLIKLPAQMISLSALPENMMAHGFSNSYRILIVCERSIPQCLRYRVVQKTEQLKANGHHAKWIDWTQYFDVRNDINVHDVIIFYRVPGYPASTANIEYAKALNKIVIYDIDDLVFDRNELASYYKDHGSQLNKKEFQGILKGADLYKSAIQLCDYVTTSTPVLQSRLENLFDGSNAVFIHPNGIDQVVRNAANAFVPKDDDETILFYGSGSNTHDNDFELITPAIEKILEEFSFVKLVIVGHLTVSDTLTRFGSRIVRLPLMPVEQYLLLLKRADINLAPLVPGLFADCKSEIKWLEAAFLGVPSVVSNTDIYLRVIEQGVNAVIADANIGDMVAIDTNDLVANNKPVSWYQAIAALVNNPQLRESMVNEANTLIESQYSEKYLGQLFVDNITTMIEQNIGQKRAYYYQPHSLTVDDINLLKPSKNQLLNIPVHNKKRLVLVNVLYPPQAMGGATIVVRNIAEQLASRYAEEYDVFVLTTDIENLYSYQVKTYSLNNVYVTAISVPKGSDIDIRHCDETIKDMVIDYFNFIKPDVIHFHCIQHLTASVLDAAIELSIPYAVTVHDAWWISQHQFLLDIHGVPVNSMQCDPIHALQTVNQPLSAGDILQRYQFLRERLNKANTVFAVSDYQKRLYEANGIDNVKLNINGVDLPVRSGVSPSKLDDLWSSQNNKQVVLGFVGSVCDHKGYYFAKSAITSLSERCDLSNIIVVVIDFNTSKIYEQQWGEVKAYHIPKFNDGNMADFYDKIDVLVAPSIWPESFGIVSREAVLTGTYAVVSDSGGLAEVINSHTDKTSNGAVFPMGDKIAFQSIITNINQQPERFKEKIKAIDATNILCVDDQVDDLVKHYTSIY